MKLYVVQVANGNITVVSEWSDNAQGAIMAFHERCRLLWSDAATITANVKILNESLDCYAGYSEYIHHDTEPEEA